LFANCDKVGEVYGRSKDTVARYLRVHQLIPKLKERLDFATIPFTPAVTVSFLKKAEQKEPDRCMEQNGFSRHAKS